MLRWIVLGLLLLTGASPVFAQQYENARRLGGPTSFYKPPLTDAGSLKRMAERSGMPEDIRAVMRDAGIPEVADAFIAAISRGTATRVTGNCSSAPTTDGVFECQEPVGSMYEWMAYRPRIRGKSMPARMQRVRWAGRRPFAAFLVRMTVRDSVYTFVVPKPCANISLVSVGTAANAVNAPGPGGAVAGARGGGATPQQSAEQAAREQAARDQAAREQAAREQAAREQAARDQAAREQAAREQAAREQAARDQAARDQNARNNATAGNPNPGNNAAAGNPSGGNNAGRANNAAGANNATGGNANGGDRGNAAAPSSAAAQATTAPVEVDHPSTPFFVDALVGGERRNRPADLSEGKRTDYTQGSGFIGLKIGVAKKFESNWEVGGAVGLGAMFLFKHDTTNQWPWFAELEVNRYFGRWFVGTGASIWDFTRSDLWTPSGDVRFGIPLGHHPNHPIFFLGEGRWYLDHRTHLETHREMWGGLRIHF